MTCRVSLPASTILWYCESHSWLKYCSKIHYWLYKWLNWQQVGLTERNPYTIWICIHYNSLFCNSLTSPHLGEVYLQNYINTEGQFLMIYEKYFSLQEKRLISKGGRRIWLWHPCVHYNYKFYGFWNTTVAILKSGPRKTLKEISCTEVTSSEFDHTYFWLMQ